MPTEVAFQRLEATVAGRNGFHQRLPMFHAVHLTSEINKVATDFGGRFFRNFLP